jgi:hypothetical protein
MENFTDAKMVAWLREVAKVLVSSDMEALMIQVANRFETLSKENNLANEK